MSFSNIKSLSIILVFSIKIHFLQTCKNIYKRNKQQKDFKQYKLEIFQVICHIMLMLMLMYSQEHSITTFLQTFLQAFLILIIILIYLLNIITIQTHQTASKTCILIPSTINLIACSPTQTPTIFTIKDKTAFKIISFHYRLIPLFHQRRILYRQMKIS